jgi:hypothetical protein
MSGQPIRIICDRAKAQPASAGDGQEVSGHHRYYGAPPSTAASGSPRAAAVRVRAAQYTAHKNVAGLLPPRSNFCNSLVQG